LTVLYLHGQDGNLGNTVDTLAALHSAGVNVLAFDYRGYGQSQFQRPSEARWREDAEAALEYLTGTRHVAPGTITMVGNGLGANLALEAGARHPELAGVALESPLASPMNAIFNDPRAHLVPSRLLVRDRFDLSAPAAVLRIPSLWLIDAKSPQEQASWEGNAAFQSVNAVKNMEALAASPEGTQSGEEALSRWLGEISGAAQARQPSNRP
jgi:pimeloyl-ACP methyl ester carboxylesterase